MTREERLERKREDQRRRRAASESIGLCGVCCKRTPAPGSKHCDECNTYARDHRAKAPRVWDHNQHVSRTDRFLVCCQAHGSHRDGCEASR